MAGEAVSPALRQGCLAVLSEPELARYANYKAPAARDRYLLGRAMVRAVLSRQAAVPPGGWAFGASEHGRPHVVSPQLTPPLHFNLTHTHGLLALVVGGEAEIGIDAECIERPRSVEAVAANYFAPAEQALLDAAPPAQRGAVFFDIWTLREAYAKARGLGLALPLNSYHFGLDGDVARLECGARCHDDAQRWRFHRLRPTTRHVVAVAQAGSQVEVWPPAVHWLSEAELLVALQQTT